MYKKGNYSKPSYAYFFKAKDILDHVKGRFPSLNAYYEANFGRKINSDTCVDIIGKYLSKNKITGEITINFAPGLTCSVSQLIIDLILKRVNKNYDFRVE